MDVGEGSKQVRGLRWRKLQGEFGITDVSKVSTFLP